MADELKKMKMIGNKTEYILYLSVEPHFYVSLALWLNPLLFKLAFRKYLGCKEWMRVMVRVGLWSGFVFKMAIMITKPDFYGMS